MSRSFVYVAHPLLLSRPTVGETVVEEMMYLPIQINGKFRGTIRVSRSATDQHVQEQVLASTIGQKWIRNQDQIIKIIIPKNRPIIGFVVKK